MKDTLRTLAEEEWRIQIDDIDYNEAFIVRPDKERRGTWIGPLATIHLGMTTSDDNGDDAIDLDCQDGRNLLAILLLPQFAELITWADDEMSRIINQIGGGELPDAFLRDLKKRVEWLRGAVDQRGEIITGGITSVMRCQYLEQKQHGAQTNG